MSKDIIYREDAMALVNKPICPTGDSDYDEGKENEREAIKESLIALPSADRPQGDWIDAEIPLESGGSMPIQVCNLCNTFYPLAYTGGGHRFCPNCGARMKGADDDQ